MEQVTHENLRDQINSIDKRVLVLETEINGVKKDIKENHALIERISSKVDEMRVVLVSISTESKALRSYFVIGVGALGALFTVLEFWFRD